MIGRQIVGCVNLGEKNITGFTLQFLLAGFEDGNGGISIISNDPKVSHGQIYKVNIFSDDYFFAISD